MANLASGLNDLKQSAGKGVGRITSGAGHGVQGVGSAAGSLEEGAGNNAGRSANDPEAIKVGSNTTAASGPSPDKITAKQVVDDYSTAWH
jgi:hypothetical protein